MLDHPVEQGDPGAGAEDDRADADDQVEGVPAEPVAVGPHPPGHAHDAEDVHGEEGEVEADEHDPEADLAQPLVEHLAGDLRRPEVDGAEDGEHDRPVEHVVEVGHDEVAVGHGPVEGQDRHHHPGDAAEQEDEQEADGEQHGHGQGRPCPSTW